jgi:hypothetical protein
MASGRRAWVVELVTQIVKDQPTAEMVVERLQEEGLLVLGYGDKEVDRVIEMFTNTFGTTKVSRYDRFAANRLVEKYGSQAVVGIIDLLGKNAGEKFAPVTNSVSQLEEKMPSVLNFLRNLKSEETLDI